MNDIEPINLKCDCGADHCESMIYAQPDKFDEKLFVMIGCDGDEEQWLWLTLSNIRKFANDLLALVAQMEEQK